MDSYYGYDPSKYMKDYSWISRDLNPVISKFASQIPELIETQKAIKENKRFKEQTWDQVNQYLNEMDDSKITNIASSMGLDYSDSNTAREKLRAMLPKYNEKSTNEEYAEQMTHNFFVPYLNAAQSDKGGGPLTFGDLTTLRSGVVQDAIRKTAVGKQMSDNEQYNLGRQRQEEEFKTKLQQNTEESKSAVNDKFGEDGTQNAVDAFEAKKSENLSTAKDVGLKYDENTNAGVPLSYENISKRQSAALREAKLWAKNHESLNIDLKQLENEVNAYFDKQLELIGKAAAYKNTQRDDTFRAQKDAADRAQRQYDKANPIVSESNINQEFSSQLNEISALENARQRIINSKNSSSEAKKELANIDNKLAYLNTYKEQKQNVQGEFANAGEDAGRRSALDKAYLNQGEAAKIKRNTMNIDNSKQHVGMANKKYSSNPKKLQEEFDIMKKNGVAYMYNIEKNIDGKQYITLKPEYAGYADYLTTGKYPAPEQVTNFSQQTTDVDKKYNTQTDVYSQNKERIAAAKKAVVDPNANQQIKLKAKKLLDSLGIKY